MRRQLKLPTELALFMFMFLLLAGCGGQETALAKSTKEALKKRAGPRITHALKDPIRVQSFYLNPIPGNQGFEPGEEFTEILGWLGRREELGYAILGIGADLSSAQEKQVADLLLPRSNYRILSGPGDVKMCIFSPRHGLRFTTVEHDTVDALVCFDCAQLSLRTIDGKEGWGGDFDPMEVELKRVFDEFLPPRGKAR